LFPDVDREDSSLEGVCGTIAELAFADAIDGQQLLLTDTEALTAAHGSIIIPSEILDIWPAEQAAALLDEAGRPALSRHVKPTDRKKLIRWHMLDEIDKNTLLTILRSRHLPKPATWRQLMILWAYIAPEITGYRHSDVSGEDLRIVPVQGQNVLYAAAKVVRLGE